MEHRLLHDPQESRRVPIESAVRQGDSSTARHQPLSICYAAVGHDFVSTSGPTRNVIQLAEALSQRAKVTVVFRRVLEPIRTEKFHIVAIDPSMDDASAIRDGDATRGLNALRHLAYLRRLRSFAKESASSYDLILEKGWRLSGFLLDAFRRYGTPGILIENDIRYWHESLAHPRLVVKYLLHRGGQCLARFYSRRAPLIIAETEELKAMLVQHRRIVSDQIEVVELGVDHSAFRPMDQYSARKSLGIALDQTVLLYVGGMDKYHDLGPVIEAMASIKLPLLELHLVGDGEHRRQYEEKVRNLQARVVFHGRVPHPTVPEYVAAADLCLAPYENACFHNGLVTFSTLKIPEYLACGRPVVSIPSGHIRKLISDRVAGFLFPNDVSSWTSFLKDLPSRERLREMGQAAARSVEFLSWEKTAAKYLEISRRLVG